MERETIELQTKRVEQDIVQISAKVADAAELLAGVQQALEELYVSLADAEK